MGSKRKIAKYILPIVLRERTINQWYVEPFVGGCNMIDKVKGNRIGADLNKYVIAMWSGLQNNHERPHVISRELYSKVKLEYDNGTSIEYDDFMKGWVGWMGSFNGKFFDGGYGGKTSKRDYISEQIRNTKKQIPKLFDTKFVHSSYENLNIPDNSIIYCDIPYKDTTNYTTSKEFDYDKFWEWCRVMSDKGHKVFISEYQAPVDFVCIWERNVTNSMSTRITHRPIERLFIYNKQAKPENKFW